MEYYVRQHFPTLRWQVVAVDALQAMTMKARGEKIYKTPAQAYAICNRLQKKREALDGGKNSSL